MQVRSLLDLCQSQIAARRTSPHRYILTSKLPQQQSCDYARAPRPDLECTARARGLANFRIYFRNASTRIRKGRSQLAWMRAVRTAIRRCCSRESSALSCWFICWACITQHAHSFVRSPVQGVHEGLVVEISWVVIQPGCRLL